MAAVKTKRVPSISVDKSKQLQNSFFTKKSECFFYQGISNTIAKSIGSQFRYELSTFHCFNLFPRTIFPSSLSCYGFR